MRNQLHQGRRRLVTCESESKRTDRKGARPDGDPDNERPIALRRHVGETKLMRIFNADDHDSDDEKPLAARLAINNVAPKTVGNVSDDDSEDDEPLAARFSRVTAGASRNSVKRTGGRSDQTVSAHNKAKPSDVCDSLSVESEPKDEPEDDGRNKWSTLEHNGVVFPPPYKPHGVKMLYHGQPVDLTPEQEEVATMFAVMKDTEYASNETFINNFFTDWRKILGKTHIITKFELCNFTPIYEWHLREKEKKNQMTLEEKKTLQEEKSKQEEKFMWAFVDSVKEKVGNFRVEPPGLFRGRGEHPKVQICKHLNWNFNKYILFIAYVFCSWKEVKHDNTITWLACWNDPINEKDIKYVFLAASSSLKGQSDKEKYEKARKLKDYIGSILENYTKDFRSKDQRKKQIAVATYLIDKLAPRAGNEKDENEADTVGCCTLKVENVTCLPPNKLQFDFLGKDSIRYYNTVEVEPPVYKAIKEFCAGKNKGGCVFDKLDTTKLNAHLKALMPGLTAKVFRTYNASITLDAILNKETTDGTPDEKAKVYQRANKEVKSFTHFFAIICNHQRAVPKSHDSQMNKLNEKIDELTAQRDELNIEWEKAKKLLSKKAKKRKLVGSDGDVKRRRKLTPEMLQKKLSQVETRIVETDNRKNNKEDLKTVALGTSKINYLDPRITVAWCKTHEVPIDGDKIFTKTILEKFAWAMDVDPDFRF
ncbi:DNA topoisomerase 1 beta-like [Hordeum vulgare subsp. vulgare]|uniref:DNA topoisomerase 1 beta-like n=1 Tax=Hordeum vulgare subsp. vulgare TaxID=112509 RepID=UPI001D1A5546|nr:DNA topoisomerase 1 beta-like [Hordeum vulgare subsp. vulgare]